MNTNEVRAALRTVAQTTSTKLKTELLKRFLAVNQFKRVVQYALEPHRKFGIIGIPANPATVARTGIIRRTQRPAASAQINMLTGFTLNTWRLLDDLSSRAITGNAAAAAVRREAAVLTPDSRELLDMILKKDLGAGIGATLVNKAEPGTIAEFPYMRCSAMSAKVAEWPWDRGVYVQTKADGMYVNVDLQTNAATQEAEVTITSRQGKELENGFLPTYAIERLSQVAKVFMNLPGMRLMGELVLYDRATGKPAAREISNGAMNSVRQGGEVPEGLQVRFLFWDMIPLSCAIPGGRDDTRYAVRFARLKEALLTTSKTSAELASVIPTTVVRTLASAYLELDKLLAAGEEGAVFKHPDMPWEDRTSPFQVKAKIEETVDLEIVGFTQGTGKNKHLFGSILYASHDGLLEVAATGIPDKERARIHAIRDSLVGTIGEVKANGIMYSKKPGKPHSLFLPRHVRLRDDKRTADTLPEIAAKFDAARANLTKGKTK